MNAMKWRMETFLKILLGLIGSLAVSTAAWGTVCTPGTLADYMATGFSCSLGDLQFSEFGFSTNFTAGSSVRTANAPASIIVTPQVLGDEKGFAFSNMNVSFFPPNGSLSNTTSSVDFEVDALGAPITDASLQLGTHSFTPPKGQVLAFFSDWFGTIFSLAATHDPGVDSQSASTSFAGVTEFRAGSGVAAASTGFVSTGVDPGRAFVDGYTVLLSTSPIPEPEIYAMLAAGLGLMGFVARRRKLQIAAA